MRSISCVLLLAVVLGSCGLDKTSQPPTVDIFDKAQVNTLAGHGAELQKLALEKYNQAMVRYRKDKNYGEAIALFTGSIKCYPAARSYFEMGNAYASAKNYDQAIVCYQMAEQMGFMPVAKVLYNIACAYALKDERWKAQEYLEYAIEAGYRNKRQLATDPDLANVRKTGDLSVFRDALEGVETSGSLLWDDYLHAYKALVLPVTLDINTDKQLAQLASLWYDYEPYIPEMRTREKFSRSTGNLYYAFGSVEQNSRFVALLYAEVPDPEMGTGMPARYIVATYTPEGKLIAKLPAGGQNPDDSLYRVCTLHPDLSISISNFKNTYKTVMDQDGNGQMELISSEPRGQMWYRIGTDGAITEGPQPLTAL